MIFPVDASVHGMDADDATYREYLEFVRHVQERVRCDVETQTRPDARPLKYQVHRSPRFCGCLHVPLHWYESHAGVQQASACALAFGALVVHSVVYLILGSPEPLIWWALFGMDAAIVWWQLVLYNALVHRRPATLPVCIKRRVRTDGADDAMQLPEYAAYRQTLEDMYASCVDEYASRCVDHLVAQRVTTVKEVRDEPLYAVLGRSEV